MPILYNLRRTADGYMIAKFDANFNIAAIYTLSPRGSSLACDCPNYPRLNRCKHVKMVPIFAANGAIDSDQFYEYERQLWHRPIQGPWTQDDPGARKAAEAAAAEPETISQPAPEPTPQAQTAFRRRI